MVALKALSVSALGGGGVLKSEGDHYWPDRVGSPSSGPGAELLLSSHQRENPRRLPGPIISGYVDDLWLWCHFHSAGLIVPNGGGGFGGGWGGFGDG